MTNISHWERYMWILMASIGHWVNGAILLYLGLVITGRSPADSISKKNEIFRLPNTDFWFCQYLLKRDTISCQYLEFCGGPRDTRKIQPARRTAPYSEAPWAGGPFTERGDASELTLRQQQLNTHPPETFLPSRQLSNVHLLIGHSDFSLVLTLNSLDPLSANRTIRSPIIRSTSFNPSE
ncbi:hypothetical protein PCASD_01946 [Puccinia coronata f. sp. avenae]|uniref:Uncharacterized protein n=1 Tax=Puccinia coronata f. sp. avenae TaxID=200324 RepID=A0A2N5VHM2_9BASI|nr:hypothetical protein PCASD_01946 [Puccinia coronata f. sp. avenae]